jgi:hypothetical protein
MLSGAHAFIPRCGDIVSAKHTRNSNACVIELVMLKMHSHTLETCLRGPHTMMTSTGHRFNHEQCCAFLEVAIVVWCHWRGGQR